MRKPAAGGPHPLGRTSASVLRCPTSFRPRESRRSARGAEVFRLFVPPFVLGRSTKRNGVPEKVWKKKGGVPPSLKLRRTWQDKTDQARPARRARHFEAARCRRSSPPSEAGATFRSGTLPPFLKRSFLHPLPARCRRGSGAARKAREAKGRSADHLPAGATRRRSAGCGRAAAPCRFHILKCDICALPIRGSRAIISHREKNEGASLW